MKRKLFYILSSITPILLLTSCTTSWANWHPKTEGPSIYHFHHNKATPLQYKVRSKNKLLKAWNNNILDLSMLNNQFELYTLLGYIFSTLQTQTLDAYWKYSDNTWSNFQNYINKITKSVDITFKYKNTPSKTPIKVDFSNSIKKLDDGFQNYNNNDIDKSRGKNPLTNQWFHNERAYDVEYNGLSSSGLPNDFAQVASIGAPLLQIPTIKSLVSINNTFALRLSKLVNIPTDSFVAFTNFVEIVDRIFNNIIKDAAFIKWKNDANIDFHVRDNGDIDNSLIFVNAFKGFAIIDLLEVKK